MQSVSSYFTLIVIFRVYIHECMRARVRALYTLCGFGRVKIENKKKNTLSHGLVEMPFFYIIMTAFSFSTHFLCFFILSSHQKIGNSVAIVAVCCAMLFLISCFFYHGLFFILFFSEVLFQCIQSYPFLLDHCI